uniref:G protein-regulated inducer of neurite outgrowth 1-like isoform X4 n=1 Tax=Macaca mulatta TaxID=9544 RepID=UPI0010A296F8|nr:G protein-regulated inducer of neurite outgrowth 1-like isoform X4 [Macaca mulatta]
MPPGLLVAPMVAPRPLERAHGPREVHQRQPLNSCRGQAGDPSSAPDLGEAGSGAGQGWESPGGPAEPTRGSLQELNPTTRRSFGVPGSSEYKDLAQREERSEAEPETQERKLTPRTPGPGDLPSQNLPSQDALEELGWNPHLGQERAELQRPPRMDTPQSLREEDPQDQKAETPQHKRGEASRGEIKDAPQRQRVKTQRGQSPRAPQGQREEAPLGENTGVPQSRREFSPKCQGKASPQSLGKMLRSWEGNISQAWEVAPGEATVQLPEEGGSRSHQRDSCGSLKAQTPKPVGRESPDLRRRRRTTAMMQGRIRGETQKSAPAVAKLGVAQEGAWAALPTPKPPARQLLPGRGAGAVMPATLRAKGSGQQGLPGGLRGPPDPERNPHGLQGPGVGPGPGEQEVGQARLPGALRGRGGGPERPKASKAAWPAPLGRAKAPAGLSVAQQETALQRLLELHSAARWRRRRDREQQRLRVLERLHIARNRHCRVHPVGLPPCSTPATGGRDWAAARPAGAAGTDASGEDRAAAGPRGQVRGGQGGAWRWQESPFPGLRDDRPLSPQEHSELPGTTVFPWCCGSRACRVVLALPSPLWSLLALGIRQWSSHFVGRNGKCFGGMGATCKYWELVGGQDTYSSHLPSLPQLQDPLPARRGATLACLSQGQTVKRWDFLLSPAPPF